MSLLVKAFALVFVLTLDNQHAINFQLLGGIWILQTVPAIVFSLYTRWFHRWGLLGGLGHIAMTAFVLNIAIAVAVTLVLNAARMCHGRDATSPGDYFVDAGDPRVEADLASEDHLTRGEPRA